MTNNTFRRIACLVTLLALTMTPNIGVRPAATKATSVVPATGGASSATQAAPKIGRGWGSILGCAGCLVAGGLVVAGGPASILIAVNTPGSSIALMACAGSCYEALAM